MSNFLRQFHLISSRRSNSDNELILFYKYIAVGITKLLSLLNTVLLALLTLLLVSLLYTVLSIIDLIKAIAPILSRHPVVRQLHTKSIGKNLSLKTSNHDGEKEKNNKNIAVILSWMLAKESHLDKYRNIYLQRGFDVLTVNLSPKEMLFPASGSQVVATNLLDYLVANEQYEKIFVHAFSVGGYLMGEMFLKLRNNMENYQSFIDRMAGVILDSAVDFEGIPTGFPRAVSKNPITIKVLEWYISTHLALMYNISTKHYLTSSKNFHNTPLRCPALFFVSEADKVGTPASNQLVADNWTARGVECRVKCWNDTKHVSHMYKHGDEYVGEIDKFLAKLNLVKK